VPDTIRDAVLMSASELSEDARAAAEAAAVAGESFDLELVGEVSTAGGVAELVERELVSEDGLGQGAFRHALTREALYADVPWMQRRALHRRLAEALEAGGGNSREVATHWLGARDEIRARNALLRAAAESRAVHAHRDAARAGRQALELWPDGEEQEGRIEALDAYASSAELAGELAEAGRAWREICGILAGLDAGERLAGAQRRLAAVHGLKGDRESAAAARRAAAEAYAAAGMPAEAAIERLAIADQLLVASHHSAAIEVAQAAGREAGLAERIDLRARALGLEGVSRATRGDFEGGLETVQAGLALALEHGLTPVAAELYQRLSVVLYDAADYRRAQETLDTALDLCRTGLDGRGPRRGGGAAGRDGLETELLCLTCMIYVLRECGEWSRALAIGRDLIAEDRAAWVSEGLIGVIYAFQGKLRSARRLLSSSISVATQYDDFNMIVDSTAALAWIAATEGHDDEAARLCRSLLERWESSEDHHVSVRGLRFAAGFFARRGDLAGAHACAEALTRIASATGHADALAALAQAIGETALADGDPATAAEQLSRAVELHRDLDVPFERAEIELRAGVALGAMGAREPALERLSDAYRTARKLGAAPLAAEAAREVAALGESIARRLGRRAAADATGGGLSRRERQIVRLVAVGRTNREIAQELFLSPRTVDMHVRNLLRKLDCRSRVEAARRAGELGLLV
jgi:DNA-binding NarL/FixJ family response regulator